MGVGWVFYDQLKSIFSLTIISCVAKHQQQCKTISGIQLHPNQMQPQGVFGWVENKVDGKYMRENE